MMAKLVILIVLLSIVVAQHYRRMTAFALSSPMNFPIHQVEDFVIVYPSVIEGMR